MNPLIKFVQLKLDRATFQSETLIADTRRWMLSNEIKTRCELREGRLGFRIIQEDYTESPPLDQWGLLLGECAHNMRSALDNLAYALARLRKDPPDTPKEISFPIFTDRKQFLAIRQKRIGALPEKAADLIESLQPFQRDGSLTMGSPKYDGLNLLQQINNIDKHRVPAFALIAQTEIQHKFEMQFGSAELAEADGTPDTTVWRGPLSPGIILIEQRTKSPLVQVKGTCSLSARVEIQLEGSSTPLVDILNLCGYVKLVCSQFNPFFELA